MSKFTVGFYAALLLSLTISSAFATIVVSEISQIQVNALNDDFTASTDSADWSIGASAWGLSEGLEFLSCTDATVAASLTGNNDLSDGSGLAKSTYSGLTFTITLNDCTLDSVLAGTIVLGGTLTSNELLSEVETEVDSDLLKVSGIVDITSFSFTPAAGYLDDIKWVDDMNEKAALIGEILLPTGTNIIDYSSDYSSDNLTITIYADENDVPEPISVSLLSLGALALIRRRRA